MTNDDLFLISHTRFELEHVEFIQATGGVMTYFLYIFTHINIYIIIAISLNLFAGYTGILSIVHAAF